jgi:hypothetical protein
MLSLYYLLVFWGEDDTMLSVILKCTFIIELWELTFEFWSSQPPDRTLNELVELKFHLY